MPGAVSTKTSFPVLCAAVRAGERLRVAFGGTPMPHKQHELAGMQTLMVIIVVIIVIVTVIIR